MIIIATTSNRTKMSKSFHWHPTGSKISILYNMVGAEIMQSVYRIAIGLMVQGSNPDRDKRFYLF